MKRRKIWLSAIGVALVATIAFMVLRYEQARAPMPEEQRTDDTPAQQETAAQMPSIDFDDPASPLVIVNKKRPLPATYAPSDLRTPNVGGGQLRAEATDSLNTLVAAAKGDGVSFKLISGYRSYASQQSVYNGYVQRDGQAAADTYSARPGHSEHQTGWAADLGDPSGNCDLEICYAQTAGGKWLAANAHKHGFIIRYLEGKQDITGYQYEPWHIRYIGKEAAIKVFNSGRTLEELYGFPAAPSY